MRHVFGRGVQKPPARAGRSSAAGAPERRLAAGFGRSVTCAESDETEPQPKLSCERRKPVTDRPSAWGAGGLPANAYRRFPKLPYRRFPNRQAVQRSGASRGSMIGGLENPCGRPGVAQTFLSAVSRAFQPAGQRDHSDVHFLCRVGPTGKSVVRQRLSRSLEFEVSLDFAL